MARRYPGWAALLGVFLSLGLGNAAETPAASGPSGPASRQLKVALAQPLVVPGDVPRNVQNMQPLVAEAARRGAQLIVFSECGLTGYDLKGVGAKAAVALSDPALDRVAELARAHRIAIVAGLHERERDRLRNTAIVFQADGQRVVQRKHLVLDLEQRTAPVVPADRQRQLFDVAGCTCAVLICSDAGMPNIYDELAASDCQAVILIAAGGGDESIGFHQADLNDPVRLAKYLESSLTYVARDSVKLSLRLKLAQIACNQSGWDPRTGYFQCGGSSLIDRTGEVTAVIPPRFVLEHAKTDLAVGFITLP